MVEENADNSRQESTLMYHYLSDRYNVFSRAAFGRTASQEKTLRRTKSTSQITEKTENGEECQAQVLDKPDKWCIYKVPSKLRKVNEAAYTPQLLSIGPFHHGKPELNNMEIYKRICYKKFLERCKKTEDDLNQFINKRKKEVLSCYAGTIKLSIISADIIAVDACFIIELFLRNYENHENDYILSSPWLRKAVEQDLILIENQLPYFLLQELYQNFPVHVSPRKKEEEEEPTHRLSSTNDLQCCLPCSWRIPSNDLSIEIDKAKPADDEANLAHSVLLLELTCEFFKEHNKGKSVENLPQPKHFTDLVRYFLCPHKPMSCEHGVENIYAAKKLRASGVKFTPLKEKTFLTIETDEVKEIDEAKETDKATKGKLNLACFSNLNLKLTPFKFKDETEWVVRNIMALEQFLYPNNPYICNYFLLMDQLVDTVDDVDLLVENEVIINMLGSNKAVAKLVNRLCQQINEDKFCYYHIGRQLKDHYDNIWNRNVATLKRVYFKDLWTGSSTVLGVFVLLFSVIGTIKSLKS
ncbi:hypothetical protein L3X38_012789 [Prunus dulcis]|uniref:Uncharacterized protein n=1 Tax=Prunus dulcis TaxID=3755 RepID=A0AAD4WMR7_PRUDU|nr:hypothetical protein L3X38_012789 [Prunus dulcis]